MKFSDICIILSFVVYLAPKITIASVKDRLSSDKSLIPGVPLVAEAISTDKRFMQYRKYVLTVIMLCNNIFLHVWCLYNTIECINQLRGYSYGFCNWLIYIVY